MLAAASTFAFGTAVAAGSEIFALASAAPPAASSVPVGFFADASGVPGDGRPFNRVEDGRMPARDGVPRPLGNAAALADDGGRGGMDASCC